MASGPYGYRDGLMSLDWDPLGGRLLTLVFGSGRPGKSDIGLVLRCLFDNYKLF